jgi:alpha-L-fucosidase
MTTNVNIHFEPNWDSLKQYQIPQWYQDAKLGIFIHWGIYSVPAYDNEWYSRNMYLPESHVSEYHRKTWGDQTQFGYKDFIPLFKGEHFDPQAWADLFQRAGARYVVPVAEHHDGFPMYASALTRWNAAKMGPQRDILGELGAAVRQRGMKLGTSSHRAEHWWFFDGGRRFPSDVSDPQYADFYGPAVVASPGNNFAPEIWHNRHWQPVPDTAFLDDWLARCKEIVENYAPQVFYFDWWIEQAIFEPYIQQFAAYYYNRARERGQEVVLNYKHGAFPEGTAVYDIERGKLREIRPQAWQTDTSLSYKSWCYIQDDHFKSLTTIIHNLADIVSKNGNLLINVGPKADGTIPDEAQSLLLGLGDWLAINKEAIYGSRPWHVYGEGTTVQPEGHMQEKQDKPFTAQDIRFTTNNGALYAISLGVPEGNLTIRSLGHGSQLDANQIDHIEMLGSSAALEWTQTSDGLTLTLPAAPLNAHASVFKITLKA